MPTLDESNFVKLVDLVYAAALDGGRWAEVTEAAGKHEHEFLGSLVPHFQRALLISAKLAKADISDRLSEEVMARVHFGVLLLGSGGLVIRANPVAQALFRDRDVLMQSNRRFTAVDRTANDQLQRAIAHAEKNRSSPLHSGPDTVIVQRTAGKAALCLLVVPLSVEPTSESADEVPSSIVFVFTETGRPQVEAADLALVYGISGAEARVAAKLAEGYTLLEIAHCFTLSIETVRTHVKHLLIKLDCRCQAGLMRKILLGPAISLTQKTPRC
jgi:DNA-binding CsgD family transcriptional regulator